MPIHFHCMYCHQLLGIARRKAGTVVRCPKCTNELVVPHLPPQASAKKKARGHSGSPAAASDKRPDFERHDFEKLFASAIETRGSKRQRRNPKATPGPTAAADQPTAAPPPNAKRPGLWLSPAAITWLSLLAVAALGAALVAGLLIGMYLARQPS